MEGSDNHLKPVSYTHLQDTHLFHDSINNNIRIAKLAATEEEIMEACRKASIHDFIMTLPEGYDTPEMCIRDREGRVYDLDSSLFNMSANFNYAQAFEQLQPMLYGDE